MSEPLTPGSTVRLNNGVEMPRLALGLSRLHGPELAKIVHHAFGVGFRHLDTAQYYGNEDDVGAAIRSSGVPREEVFYTTKLWNHDQGIFRARRSFKRSLRAVDIGHIDLFLLHWPVPRKRLWSWRVLESQLKKGRCRAIGVSNYTVRHLEELLANCRIRPAVNQVEFNPFLFQKELLNYCRENEIQLMAYSPLCKGKRFDHPVITDIAARHGRTSAQVLLRWALQHDVVPATRSSRTERIDENLDALSFSLDGEDMARLDALNENHHESWDPTDVP